MIEKAIIIAERVARNIVQELRGRPLYIIQPAAGSMVSRQLIGGRLGCFAPSLDLALQPQLEKAGLWLGPGVAVIVDVQMAFAAALNDDDAVRAVVGLMLHELAHWLDRPESEPMTDAYGNFLSRCEAAKLAEQSPAEFPPVLLAHSESFQRLCVHLWYRSMHGGGIVLRARHLAFGNDYCGLEFLPSPGEFIDALWPELQTLQSLPLRDVSALEPPREFIELWDQVLTTFAAPVAA